HASMYGTLLGPSSGQLAGWNWSFANAGSLTAVLLSPGRGLLVYQPWIMLIALNLLPDLRGDRIAPDRAAAPPGWAAYCIGALVLHLALISSWKCWWGGYCWGSRLAAEAVPLMALLCLKP